MSNIDDDDEKNKVLRIARNNVDPKDFKDCKK